MRTRLVDYAILAVMMAVATMTIGWVILGGVNALLAAAAKALVK
jgi:hypothetical protein